MKKWFLLCFFTFLSSLYCESFNIIILETMTVPVVQIYSSSVVNELNLLAQEKNVEIKYTILNGQGDKELCGTLLRDYLQEETPDLIVTVATLATQAAMEVVKDEGIPIVFCVVSEPVGAGIVNELGVPSFNNITGVAHSQQRDTMVEMVMRVLSDYRFEEIKIGIVSSDYPSSVADIREIKKRALLYDNLEIIDNQFPYQPLPQNLAQLLKDYEQAIEELEDRVDYFWEVSGPLSELNEGSQLLLQAEKPLILANTPRTVEKGALMAIATDYSDTGKQVVEMVWQILEGRDAGTIPVAVPRKFELHINMGTAELENLSIPSHMLMIAGEKIYW